MSENISKPVMGGTGPASQPLGFADQVFIRIPQESHGHTPTREHIADAPLRRRRNHQAGLRHPFAR
jgi:hypothetical protein